MFISKLRFASIFLVVGLFIAGAVLAGTSNPTPENEGRVPLAAKGANPEKTGQQKNKIELIKPEKGGLERVSVQTANFSSPRQVDLNALATGVLKEVRVDIGDKVTAGQLLAQIVVPGHEVDQAIAANEAQQARFLISESQSHLQIAKAEVEAARGMIKLREAEVSTAKVMKELRKKEYDLCKTSGNAIELKALIEAERLWIASKGQSDVAEAAVENAKAELAVKTAKLLLAEATAQTTATNSEAVSIARRKANLELDAMTKITAPFDGLVAQRHAHSGDPVSPGTPSNPTTLFTIIQTNFLQLPISLAPHVLSSVKTGTPVDIDVFGLGKAGKITGKLGRIGVTVDPISNVLPAMVYVPNQNGSLMPGMRATATIELGKGPADALRLPVRSVLNYDGFSQPRALGIENADILSINPSGFAGGVYVYRNGKAQLRAVKISNIHRKEVEIISGLSADDQVVANPADLERDDIERVQSK